MSGLMLAAVLVAAAPRPNALEVLPLGSVRAEGWLLRQLEKQRDGLTGHAEELYDDIAHSDWLTNVGKGGEYAWERGPYYARGLVALSLTMGDEALKSRAKRWIDAIVASQRNDGDFGPKCDNWWANMLALQLLRDWAEATGDVRVVPFMERYFAYQLKRLPTHPLRADSMWAMSRGGDEVDVALWLHDRTGDTSALALARLVAAQSADWTGYYWNGGDGGAEDGYRCHIVNFMQGLKLPALLWRLNGDVRDRDAYAAAFDPNGWAMRMHGRPDRAVNGTEPLSGKGAAQGTELCATAERMLSCQKVVAASGALTAADDLEIAAFNTLPATLGDDGRGIRYYQILNQPSCVFGRRLGFECNPHGDAHTPGPDSGFGCCRSNYHFAWPRFVQSLWMRRNGGLAAIAYAPSCVTTELATVRMSGVYPFGDVVRLEIVAAKGTSWPLSLRIPGWTKNPEVRVNGTKADCAAGAFLSLTRIWAAGDVVELRFPAEVEVFSGINCSVALRRGPLVYALLVESDVRTVFPKEVDGKPARGREHFPVREYLCKKPWNRVLKMKDGNPVGTAFTAAARAPVDPFVQGAAPCTLTVSGGTTSYGGWGTMRPDLSGLFSALPLDPPPSPVKASEVSNEAPLTLVPIGTTQTRITLLPWTGS